MGHVALMQALGSGQGISTLLGPQAGGMHPAFSAKGEYSRPDLPEQGAGPGKPHMNRLLMDVLAMTVATGPPS